MKVAPLDHAQLAEAELVLADACPFDRATDVAEEKLFGPGPLGPALAFGAWRGDELIGVAAVSDRWLRLIAVIPHARGEGAGSALLAACEHVARTTGVATLRTLDQPGNYLAPGIDARNTYAIEWLERRGYQRHAELRTNISIAVRGNPRVSSERAAELAATAAAKGYEIRRARPDERSLLDAVASEFGGGWPFELERALGHEPAGVHVATHDGAYCAFAAHDGNNRGLGWFGPTGTWPAHRGKGLGEAVLLACLVDVGAEHGRCEVAWIGPRPFYDKVAGIVDERRFVLLTRTI
ncbi:MAG TPA: GNAT family N-acetyltransferase [Kofleriaceae bacterium]